MAKKPPIPPCPKCRSKKQVTVFGVVGDMFHCSRAGCGNFDVEPNEGSSVFNDPSKRMQIQERQAGRDPKRR